MSKDFNLVPAVANNMQESNIFKNLHVLLRTKGKDNKYTETLEMVYATISANLDTFSTDYLFFHKDDLISFIDCYFQLLLHIDKECSYGEYDFRKYLAIIFTIISKSTNIANYFVRKMTIVIFDSVFNSTNKYEFKNLLMKSYNSIIHKTSRQIREEVFRLKLKGTEHMYGELKSGKNLTSEICFCGDFDYQVNLLVTYFRIMPMNASKTAMYFPENLKSPREHIHLIVKKDFDVTVRQFLNILNEEVKMVCSFPCDRILLGEHNICKPVLDTERETELWADFNIGFDTVSIYCDSNSLRSDIPNTGSVYSESFMITETLVFNASDVANIEMYINSAGTHEGEILNFLLKKPCNFSRETSAQIVTKNFNVKMYIKNFKKLPEFKKIILQTMFHRFAKKFQAANVPEVLESNKKSAATTRLSGGKYTEGSEVSSAKSIKKNLLQHENLDYSLRRQKVLKTPTLCTLNEGSDENVPVIEVPYLEKRGVSVEERCSEGKVLPNEHKSDSDEDINVTEERRKVLKVVNDDLTYAKKKAKACKKRTQKETSTSTDSREMNLESSGKTKQRRNKFKKLSVEISKIQRTEKLASKGSCPKKRRLKKLYNPNDTTHLKETDELESFESMRFRSHKDKKQANKVLSDEELTNVDILEIVPEEPEKLTHVAEVLKGTVSSEMPTAQEGHQRRKGKQRKTELDKNQSVLSLHDEIHADAVYVCDSDGKGVGSDTSSTDFSCNVVQTEVEVHCSQDGVLPRRTLKSPNINRQQPKWQTTQTNSLKDPDLIQFETDINIDLPRMTKAKNKTKSTKPESKNEKKTTTVPEPERKEFTTTEETNITENVFQTVLERYHELFAENDVDENDLLFDELRNADPVTREPIKKNKKAKKPIKSDLPSKLPNSQYVDKRPRKYSLRKRAPRRHEVIDSFRHQDRDSNDENNSINILSDSYAPLAELKKRNNEGKCMVTKRRKTNKAEANPPETKKFKSSSSSDLPDLIITPEKNNNFSEEKSPSWEKEFLESNSHATSTPKRSESESEHEIIQPVRVSPCPLDSVRQSRDIEVVNEEQLHNIEIRTDTRVTIEDVWNKFKNIVKSDCLNESEKRYGQRYLRNYIEHCIEGMLAVVTLFVDNHPKEQELLRFQKYLTELDKRNEEI